MDDLSRFCCQNPDGPSHGQRGQGNLTVCMRYGIHQHQLLYCKICKARFSARKGTPAFECHLPPDKILAVLQHLADGCGIRQTARLTGVNKNTVNRLALKAGEHAQALHDELVAFSPQHPQGPTR